MLCELAVFFLSIFKKQTYFHKNYYLQIDGFAILNKNYKSCRLTKHNVQLLSYFNNGMIGVGQNYLPQINTAAAETRLSEKQVEVCKHLPIYIYCTYAIYIV